MKKLSYSKTICNNYIYFSFDADVFDTETVTSELGITPTSVMIKSDPIPKSTSWKYKVDAKDDLDLEKYLNKLFDVLEPKIELIKSLKKKLNVSTRLQFVIDIDINPDASTPYFGLNSRAINFLAQTQTEVDFDLYKLNTL